MVITTKKALKLCVGEPQTLIPNIRLTTFGISLLINHLINILIIIEEHWLRLEHLCNSDVPIGSPPLLFKFG